MSALVAFILTAPASFALGWYSHGITDRHIRRPTMNARIQRTVTRVLDWLADPRKLTVLVVVTAAAVLSSIVYTWSADQQSEDRTARAKADVYRCVTNYVQELSRTNAPRTAASVLASDARRDWDAGHSKEHPDLTRAQLKARYLHLYAQYVTVRAENPLPEFSNFCEQATR
jgi:hypothetical protein